MSREKRWERVAISGMGFLPFRQQSHRKQEEKRGRIEEEGEKKSQAIIVSISFKCHPFRGEEERGGEGGGLERKGHRRPRTFT